MEQKLIDIEEKKLRLLKALKDWPSRESNVTIDLPHLYKSLGISPINEIRKNKIDRIING
jgi:hypothetical protein